MTERNKEFQKRLEDFIKRCINLVNGLPSSVSNQRIFPQFIDSATSVGANYQEACEAESAKDFVHKMKICKKEGKETNYWLRILDSTNNLKKEELSLLIKESEEIVKIFSSIVSKFASPKLNF